MSSMIWILTYLVWLGVLYSIAAMDYFASSGPLDGIVIPTEIITSSYSIYLDEDFYGSLDQVVNFCIGLLSTGMKGFFCHPVILGVFCMHCDLYIINI